MDSECERCDGTGTVKCKKCDGAGTVKCKKCDGAGTVKCKKCDGAGVIVLCDDCGERVRVHGNPKTDMFVMTVHSCHNPSAATLERRRLERENEERARAESERVAIETARMIMRNSVAPRELRARTVAPAPPPARKRRGSPVAPRKRAKVPE